METRKTDLVSEAYAGYHPPRRRGMTPPTVPTKEVQKMDETPSQTALRERLRAVGMALFRREGLRFTMQEAAHAIHISKKNHLRGLPLQGGAAARYGGRCLCTHPRPQTGHSGRPRHADRQAPAPSSSPCRRNTPRWICSRWICWTKKYPAWPPACASIWKPAWGAHPRAAAAGDGTGRHPHRLAAGAAADDFGLDRELPRRPHTGAAGHPYAGALDEMMDILLDGLLIR